MAVASLVLGIVAIVAGIFFGPFSFIGIIAGVVGIVLGVLAKKSQPSGMATGGLVTSIIGTVLSVIIFLACVACLGAMGTGLQKAGKDQGFKKLLEEAQKIQQQQQQQTR